MIRITVELLSARTGKRSTLGIMDICNKGDSEDPKRGNYSGFLYRKGEGTFRPSRAQRTGQVLNYPRQSYVVWRLILRMLAEMFPEESGIKKSRAGRDGGGGATRERGTPPPSKTI